MLVGQVIEGGVVSTTVTVAVHCAVAPRGSFTVSKTVVVPFGYGPAGDCVIVNGSPSGSDEPSLIEAFATQFASAETVTFLHLATGTWLIVAHAPMHVPDTFSV